MKIKNIYVCLIVLFAIQAKVFAASSLIQTITTNVPATVNVSATGTATTGTITPSTGANSGVSSQFLIQVNCDDSRYDYILTAEAGTTGGTQVNAYFLNSTNPYIIFANQSASYIPTAAAIADIKTSPTPVLNQNAIAYPVVNTLTNLSSITYANDPLYGGACFKVKTGSSRQGTVKQTVNPTPLGETYSVVTDMAGVYVVNVKLSAYRKP